MERDFLAFAAKTLSDSHYFITEIELFYLSLDVFPIFQFHKSSSQLVAYTMALEEWNKNKGGTPERLIEILIKLSWKLAAGRIEDYNTKSAQRESDDKKPTIEETPSKISVKNELIEAVRTGNIRKVKKLVAEKTDVDFVNESFESPLTLAIQQENLDIVKCLIEADCNVNLLANTANRMTPLHLAVEKGNYDIVETLRKNEANVNAKDVREWTPLHIAIQHANRRIYEYLMGEKANFESKTDSKLTPLHLASKGTSLDIVKSLCNYGADKEAMADKDMRAVHFAAQTGRLEILKYLINQGCVFEPRNEEGLTPLLMAKRKGYAHIEKYLRENMPQHKF